MPRIQVGDISLNYIEHGRGDNVVLAVHGNLGCANWLDLAMPLLPANIRVIAAEWRGCGDSDKPEPTADYSNYTMEIHARDHLELLDATMEWREKKERRTLTEPVRFLLM